MDAQTKFGLMLAALIGNDEWVAAIEDDIAHEDAIEWLFAPVEDEDAIEDDYEWIRMGGS